MVSGLYLSLLLMLKWTFDHAVALCLIKVYRMCCISNNADALASVSIQVRNTSPERYNTHWQMFNINNYHPSVWHVRSCFGLLSYWGTHWSYLRLTTTLNSSPVTIIWTLRQYCFTQILPKKRPLIVLALLCFLTLDSTKPAQYYPIVWFLDGIPVFLSNNGGWTECWDAFTSFAHLYHSSNSNKSDSPVACHITHNIPLKNIPPLSRHSTQTLIHLSDCLCPLLAQLWSNNHFPVSVFVGFIQNGEVE